MKTASALAISSTHTVPPALAVAPALIETPVGKKTKVAILRNGKKQVLTVKIGELEDKDAAQVAEKPQTNLGLTVRDITPELASRYGLSEENGL